MLEGPVPIVGVSLHRKSGRRSMVDEEDEKDDEDEGKADDEPFKGVAREPDERRTD